MNWRNVTNLAAKPTGQPGRQGSQTIRAPRPTGQLGWQGSQVDWAARVTPTITFITFTFETKRKVRLDLSQILYNVLDKSVKWPEPQQQQQTYL